MTVGNLDFLNQSANVTNSTGFALLTARSFASAGLQGSTLTGLLGSSSQAINSRLALGSGLWAMSNPADPAWAGLNNNPAWQSTAWLDSSVNGGALWQLTGGGLGTGVIRTHNNVSQYALWAQVHNFSSLNQMALTYHVDLYDMYNYVDYIFGQSSYNPYHLRAQLAGYANFPTWASALGLTVYQLEAFLLDFASPEQMWAAHGTAPITSYAPYVVIAQNFVPINFGAAAGTPAALDGGSTAAAGAFATITELGAAYGINPFDIMRLADRTYDLNPYSSNYFEYTALLNGYLSFEQWATALGENVYDAMAQVYGFSSYVAFAAHYGFTGAYREAVGTGELLNGTVLADAFLGGAGRDVMHTWEGADFAYGGGGADDVFAGAGNDEVWGGSGDDDLLGEDGDDLLDGNAGVDFLFGGAGRDNLIGGSGDDVLNGGVDLDAIDYSSETAAVGVYLYDVRNFGGSVGTAAFATGTSSGVDYLLSIENAAGGAGADYLFGDFQANRLDGNGGNDVLRGLQGVDTLNGGSGIDLIIGDEGGDILAGGNDRDIIDGGADNDTIHGDGGNDEIYGGAGSDQLFGDAGSDIIFTDGLDSISGGTETDYLVWNLATAASLVVTNAMSVEWATGRDAADTISAAGISNFIEIQGQGGGDTLTAGNGGSLLLGGAGIDRLVGGNGIDHMVGGSEADTFRIATGGSTDYVYDFLRGTDRIDMIGTVAGFGSLAVNTAYSGAGWYGYGYGSGTVWVNTGAGGALAAGDFAFV